jgi:hypothetical protein
VRRRPVTFEAVRAGQRTALLKPRGPFERGWLVVPRPDEDGVIDLFRVHFEHPAPSRIGGVLVECPCCNKTLVICHWDNGTTTAEPFHEEDGDVPF